MAEIVRRTGLNKDRDKLIDIVARCSDKSMRMCWIIEMMTETDIECSESQCTGCPIAKECIELGEAKVVPF